MQEIEKCDKQVGYTYQQQVRVVYVFLRIPGNYKDREAYHDTEELDQCMEYQVVYCDGKV